MSLSIHNQFPATVVSVTSGKAMTTVKARLAGDQEVTAAVATDTVAELGIAAGSPVTVLVKATQVALATGDVRGVSVRNRLAGTVTSVTLGAAMANVGVAAEGGTLTAAVTKEAVDELGITAGTPVVALVKSTEVALATA
ncbi:TOBE domain-containing protein [Actinacidiphila sp. bgisy160]|uniref:TOBE domain-containing protein n=1 Tax=Actinacidiphila sp. bgisy160 TaxID=3413796 RepID=UPI003D7450AF